MSLDSSVTFENLTRISEEFAEAFIVQFEQTVTHIFNLGLNWEFSWRNLLVSPRKALFLVEQREVLCPVLVFIDFAK